MFPLTRILKQTMGAIVGTACTFALTANTYAAGLLTPSSSQLPAMQMKEHHVDVTVNGAYITTSVEQVFHNPNDETLEAIYSFPVPDAAAVGEFIYWVDGQAVIGEVVEKTRARQIYQQEKNAGREAALVEKNSFRTFDISVTPVLPRSDVKIRLVYVQSAYVDSGVGRYVYPLEEGGTDEQKQAFWSRNETVSEKFTFDFHLRSGYPVEALRLPKHGNASVTKIAEDEWRVGLNNQATNNQQAQQNIAVDDDPTSISSSAINATKTHVTSLDEDIVVYWRLQEDLPGSVDLVAYKEPTKERGTFMLTLTPGDDLSTINTGRDWVFVLDVSGSMEGKYATLAEGVRQALQKLPTGDRFRVILFNNSAHDLIGGLQAVTPSNIEKTLRAIEYFQPNGGTNLYAGLELGLKGMNADVPTGLVLVTDGVANVGTTERKAFLSLLNKYDVRLFTFIMGNNANRPLLEEMTTVSNGFALSVSNSDDIMGHILQTTSKLGHHALRDIRLEIRGTRTTDVIPDSIGSLYRGEQLVVFGHYYGAGDITVDLQGTVGAEKRQYKTTIALPDEDTLNPEIERLWGFAKIDQLHNKMAYFGKDQDTEQAITDIATEYGLVTDYTSMILVRDEVFDQLNIARTNKERVEKEQAATIERNKAPVQKQRADANTPMYKESRPTYQRSGGSGGGAVNPMVLIVILGFAAMTLRRRYK